MLIPQKHAHLTKYTAIVFFFAYNDSVTYKINRMWFFVFIFVDTKLHNANYPQPFVSKKNLQDQLCAGMLLPVNFGTDCILICMWVFLYGQLKQFQKQVDYCLVESQGGLKKQPYELFEREKEILDVSSKISTRGKLEICD